MTDHYTLNPSQIVMYATQFCPDCMRAKKFFESNNIPYLHIGLEDNHEATEFVMKVNNGSKSVPTIIFPDGTILVEPGWDELKQKFNSSKPQSDFIELSFRWVKQSIGNKFGNSRVQGKTEKE